MGYAEKDLEWARAITGWPTFQATRNLRFQADQEVFQFLINHPDFAAAVSRGIGHEKFFVTRKEDNLFDIRHGHAKGIFWTVERNPGRAAYLAVGIYDNPAFSWLGIVVRARAYVIETFKWKPAKGSPPGEATVSIRAYLRVENAFWGWIFKLIAPLVRTPFEDKLTGAYRIAPELSQMAFEDGNGFLKKIETIQGLDPERSRRFIELVRKQKKGPTSRRSSRSGPARYSRQFSKPTHAFRTCRPTSAIERVGQRPSLMTATKTPARENDSARNQCRAGVSPALRSSLSMKRR